MKTYDSIVIGHVTVDEEYDHLNNYRRLNGGAVLYSSAAAYAMGNKTAVLTKMSEEDLSDFCGFVVPEEDAYIIKEAPTCLMVNRFLTADKERRQSQCLAQGAQISAKDIPDIDAKIYHLAGLVYGDYEPSLIKELSKKGSVAVDVQGYLRNVDPETRKMYFADWKEKKEMLPYITFLKTDAAEAEILTGLTDRAEAARVLASWGAKEVLITYNTDVTVYSEGKVYTQPIKARSVVGRTGRGDTTFAIYINERLRTSAEEALLTATAAVSLKMETLGPMKNTREDVKDYIDQFYK